MNPKSVIFVKWIYLYCSTEVAFERIKQRGREGEDSLNLDSTDNLNKSYADWIDSKDPKDVIKVMI